MKNYWQNLNEREQKLLIITSFILLAYLIYTLVYAPIVNTLKDRTLELQEKKQTLIWMRDVQKNYIVSKKSKINNSELLSILVTEIKNSSFNNYQYQLQQSGKGDIQLLFKEVPFNDFIKWLEVFSKHYAVTIKQVSVEKTEISGVVKLTTVFSLE